MADIVIKALGKTFPSKRNGASLAAVKEVDLTVASGELLTLIGPSGSGKTTLLRLIAGLEQPDSGTVSIAGQDQTGIPPGDRDLAMVFQSLALYPHLTAAENLVFGLKLRKRPASEIAAAASETARRLGIADCLERRPAELSSGQRQRVALGRALIRKPKVLLLDEPFANLDAPLRRDLRRELLQLHRELGLTAILVTHDQAEALSIGQRVAVMHRGSVVQVDRPAELQNRPANEFVAAFMDQRPV